MHRTVNRFRLFFPSKADIFLQAEFRSSTIVYVPQKPYKNENLSKWRWLIVIQTAVIGFSNIILEILIVNVMEIGVFYGVLSIYLSEKYKSRASPIIIDNANRLLSLRIFFFFFVGSLLVKIIIYARDNVIVYLKYYFRFFRWMVRWREGRRGSIDRKSVRKTLIVYGTDYYGILHRRRRRHTATTGKYSSPLKFSTVGAATVTQPPPRRTRKSYRKHHEHSRADHSNGRTWATHKRPPAIFYR